MKVSQLLEKQKVELFRELEKAQVEREKTRGQETYWAAKNYRSVCLLEKLLENLEKTKQRFQEMGE